ncbi:MAG: complex I subunit 5 family protein, partial [Gemmatimonadota bacterium]
MFAENLPRLLQPILLCLGAGLICWILGRRLSVLSRILSLAAAVAAAGQCGALWRAGQASWAPAVPWMSFGVFDVQVSLALTGLSGILALAASGFAILVLLYAWPHPVGGDGKFHAYALWSLAGAVGAFYADDLLFLLICWEFLTLCLYLLIGRGEEETTPAGAAKTFAMLGFSDCCLLLAVALVLATQGTLSMTGLSISTASAAGKAAYLLFLCAALAKAGAVPVHSWIPAAAEGAPVPVMAYVPAALDKLLGIYLLARVTLDLFAVGTRVQALLMVIGAVTILAAVFMAMVQHDVRKLLAFHAVSQVGYMVLGIGTGTAIGIVGGLFHMLNNAVYKSCLFLCAGAVQERTGETRLERLGGLARQMPLAFVCCSVAALAISGVSPLNGFVSKWLVYQGALESTSRLAPFVLVAAVFGSALTLASFVKVVHSCFW